MLSYLIYSIFVLTIMKKSCIFWNQENQPRENIQPLTQRCHVSQQSKFKPYKPAIKVGYPQPEPSPITTRRYKKPVMVIKNNPSQKLHIKKPILNNQINSGTFVGSAYMPKDKSGEQQCFHKKGVVEVHQRYYGGKQIDEGLKQQFTIRRSRSAYLNNQNSNRDSRAEFRRDSKNDVKKVWQHNKVSIKDVLEYQHAGQYRQTKIATKCNNEKSQDRKLRFTDLHQYDFRKMKPSLR